MRKRDWPCALAMVAATFLWLFGIVCCLTGDAGYLDLGVVMLIAAWSLGRWAKSRRPNAPSTPWRPPGGLDE